MEIASKYDPREVEGKWYQYWLDNKLFSSKPDGREPYTIVIPPPNVTGVLHMGHMLNNTIQDILVRRARMEGKNACWVPGTDHASIATEAKVVKKLAGEGIKKHDLTREQFLEHAWDWTHEHGGIILKQLRRLGASCDWDRTAFTMDEKRSESVIKVFVDLYNKGLIYRGLRMVNWDPKALTALSTEEVIYKEEKSHLFHLKYYVDGLEVVRLTEHIVVGVVGRCDFQTTRTKLDIHVAVFDDGNDTIHQRHNDLAAFQPLVLRILRIDTHGSIAHDGLRTCGGHHCVVTFLIPMDNVALSL